MIHEQSGQNLLDMPTWGLDDICSVNRSAKEYMYHECVSKMDKTFVWQHLTSYTTGAITINI